MKTDQPLINNFDIIKEQLKFETEDDFYFLQVLQRKKENPELGSNSKVLAVHYISSIEHLEGLMQELLLFVNEKMARVYIDLNRRSFEKIAFHTMQKIANQLMTKDFKAVKNAYASCAGMYSNEKSKRWIIDVDTKDLQYIKNITEHIYAINPEGNKILCEIPTKNGVHLISRPFDRSKFDSTLAEIHTNNPTILICAAS